MAEEHTKKITAFSRSLLESYLILRERYELLEPMLFDQKVIDTNGKGLPARGFNSIKHSLFHLCAQGIATLALDNDDKVPSLRNIHKKLQDGRIRKNLRSNFSDWGPAEVVSEGDVTPEMRELFDRCDQDARIKREMQFDQYCIEFEMLWIEFSKTSALKSIKDMRDKVTAHQELKLDSGEYNPVDISKLDIKWGDLRKLLTKMERLVELSSLLARNTSFSWESFDRQIKKSSLNFWLK